MNLQRRPTSNNLMKLCRKLEVQANMQKKPIRDNCLFSFFFNQNDLFAQCRTERLSVITSGIQKTNVL